MVTPAKPNSTRGEICAVVDRIGSMYAAYESEQKQQQVDDSDRNDDYGGCGLFNCLVGADVCTECRLEADNAEYNCSDIDDDGDDEYNPSPPEYDTVRDMVHTQRDHGNA
jgi:hypothetical protein